MVKTKVLTVLMIIFVLFLTSLVSAAVEVDTNDLVVDVSYKDLVDDDDEVDTSWQVTITNSGENTENVTLSLEGLDQGYDLSLSDSTLELSAQGSSDVTISGTVPVDVDAGVKTIGTLKVDGVSYDLKTDVQQMLEVKKIEFHVNGKLERNVNENGEEVDELEPGDEIELIFELRNLLDEDYDEGKIEGTITVELDDNDFGDDIDLEEDFEIKAGKKIDSDDEELVLTFTIPDDADEGKYTLEIKVESDDGNGADYSTEWDVKLIVERDEDDLRIEEVTLSPAELSCSRTSLLTIGVENYGTNKQKHGALSIFNTDLGIDENFPFEIERGTSNDNTYRYQYLIKLEEGQKAGKYPISVNVLYDYNIFSDKELVDLVVKKCVSVKENTVEENVETTSDTNDDEKVANVVESVKNQISSSAIVKTVEDSYNKEDFIVAVLLVTMVLIFALVVLLLVALFRSK